MPYFRSFCRSVARWMPICKACARAVALVAAKQCLQQGRLNECEEAVVKRRVGRRRLVPTAKFSLDPAGDLMLNLLWRCGNRSRSRLRIGRRGKVLGMDVPAAGDDCRSLDGVAQLADVAWPVARFQVVHHVVRQRNLSAVGQVQERPESGWQARGCLRADCAGEAPGSGRR